MQIRREIELDADLARVWHALTDRDELSGWLGNAVDLDMCPGGNGTIVDDEGTLRHALIGEFDPERRLSLRWWPEAGAVSEVTFELCPTDEGTRLVVTETPLEPASAQASVAKAAYWEARLDALWLRVSAAALVH
ncbi:MAG TPA: SRPBCC domain-containing protein [Acidimicrobiales bacterium]|nr:SRPBCC domain-containing protein [Acidimicrobiales bacterium]